MAAFDQPRTLFRICAITLIACVFAGCEKPGLTVVEVNGAVVDAATSRPLSGAQVLVVWEGEIDVLVDSQVARIRQCKTVTSADGRFRVAAWRAPRNVIGRLRAQAFVYLPGYNSRPIDSAKEHTGAELVTHPLYTVAPGEIAASDELSLEKDCAAAFARDDRELVFAIPRDAA